MSLCLGSFLKVLAVCKSKSTGVTQKLLVSRIMRIFDEEFNEDDDSAISNLVRGKKNPSDYVRENVNKLDFGEACDYAERIENEVFPLIDPSKRREILNGLKRLLIDSTEISMDAEIDLVNRKTKKELLVLSDGESQLVAALLIYVLRYTENRGNSEYIKGINEKFVADSEAVVHQFDVENQKENESIEAQAKDDYTDDEDEKILIKARKFCIKFEEELSLLPLCQIAYELDPQHKDARKIYRKYKLCSEKVRQKILELNNVPALNFTQKGWIDTCVDKYRKQIREEKLTTREFLYDGAKYLHGAKLYFDQAIDFEPYIFQRICKSKLREKGLEIKSSLSAYIDDYCYFKYKNPEMVLIPPMDYLWDFCNLSGCPEREMVFWVCKFIIESSHFMESGWANEAVWSRIGIDEGLIQTMEDMYYYALLQLHLLYVS